MRVSVYQQSCSNISCRSYGPSETHYLISYLHWSWSRIRLLCIFWIARAWTCPWFYVYDWMACYNTYLWYLVNKFLHWDEISLDYVSLCHPLIGSWCTLMFFPSIYSLQLLNNFWLFKSTLSNHRRPDRTSAIRM